MNNDVDNKWYEKMVELDDNGFISVGSFDSCVIGVDPLQAEIINAITEGYEKLKEEKYLYLESKDNFGVNVKIKISLESKEESVGNFLLDNEILRQSTGIDHLALKEELEALELEGVLV